MNGHFGDTTDTQLTPLLTVIVPVFNEAKTVIDALIDLLEEPTSKEIIIVDDGSTDTSAAEVGAWLDTVKEADCSTDRIIFFQHDTNLGKGAAIRSALEFATGSFVVVQDADLELKPSCFADLLRPLRKDQADLVIGHRVGATRSGLSLHWLGIRLLRAVVRIIYGYQISDPACCYKMLSLTNVRRMNLEAQHFEFCPEVLAKASRLKLRVSQAPVNYFPRTIEQGKKLRLLKDGWTAVRTLVRLRSWSPASDEVDRNDIGERPSGDVRSDRRKPTEVQRAG